VARPVAVAITGGIGAGKSEALKAFARHGAATISSDEIVHRLLREDDEVKRAIIDRLGEGVLSDGAIDRRKVAQRVFSDRERLDWLEALLHPRVVREYLAWRERQTAPLTVTEVPLLFEAGGETRFDKVVVVTAPARLREGRSPQVDDRERRLIPDEEKVRRADFAYENTGSLEELDEWVGGVVAKLTR
jgi:dephospho-CoA kinase